MARRCISDRQFPERTELAVADEGDDASTGEALPVSRKDFDALHALWREGIDSGPGRLGGIGAIKAEARRQMKRIPTGANPSH